MAILPAAIVVLGGLFVALAIIGAIVLVQARSATMSSHLARLHPTAAQPQTVPQALNLELYGTPLSARFLEMERADGGYDRLAEIRTTWPDPTFRCEIYSQRNNQPRRRLRGMQSLAEGEGNHFVVQGNDLAKSERILSVVVQEKINQLYRCGDSEDLHIGIHGQQFVVRKQEHYAGEAQLRHLAGMVENLRREMIAALESGVTFVIGDDEQSSKALSSPICEVCGDQAVEDVVHCKSCQTPHHLECWEYFGGCSIYACGQKEFIAPEVSVHRLLKPKRIPRRKSQN